MIKECSVTLPLIKQPINRKQSVFYNAAMKHNRDVCVAILASFKGFANRDVHVGLPMEASGVRGVRLLKEAAPLAKKEFILHMNDHNEAATEFMKKLIEANDVKATISNLDSDAFFLQNKGFDFIDIDPFGTPNPYLDMAIKRLSRNAILAVTATDTATLCGAYPQVCLREYWAHALHCSWMHEIGLRILIAKIQKIGAQYDRALTPILSYNKDHYMRIYFATKKSKEDSTKVIQTHKVGWLNQKTQEWSFEANGGTQFGPIYTGPLYDFSSINKDLFVQSLTQSESYDAWAQTLLEELDVDKHVVGYYNIPWLCKVSKNKKQPAIPALIDMLNKKKFQTAKTIQIKQAIKSTVPYQELVKILKEF